MVLSIDKPIIRGKEFAIEWRITKTVKFSHSKVLP